MTDGSESVAKLAARVASLGVRADTPFQAAAILQQALTHSSYAAEKGGLHNERLEMLGDAVLGYLVAELLFDLFPEAPEGVLTRLRASLVDEASLARQARALGLGEVVLLGRGEETSGGRDRDSLLADAFEAVVAGLYRSEGLGCTRALVHALFREHAAERGAAPQPTDFKTTLQERTQAKWRIQPKYRISSASGPDHERTFAAEAVLNETVIGAGEGRSKRLAEQRAAKAALSSWEAVEAAGTPGQKGT